MGKIAQAEELVEAQRTLGELSRVIDQVVNLAVQANQTAAQILLLQDEADDDDDLAVFEKRLVEVVDKSRDMLASAPPERKELIGRILKGFLS